MNLPDRTGHFGIYGGRYVSETLMPALLELTDAYNSSKKDPLFKKQLTYYLRQYGGRATPLNTMRWFTPTPLHPLFGADDWPSHLRSVVEGVTRFRDVNTVFQGYGILALAALGALSAWRRVRAWTLGAVVFAVFTLGPLLQINGRFLFPLDNLLREQGLSQDVTFLLPFALLHYIPVIKSNRVPNRFSVVLSLALAVLVGYGAAWLLSRVAGSRVASSRAADGSFATLLPATLLPATLLLVIVLFDQVSVPLPLSDARLPGPYAAIAAEPGDFAVLQLPLGWRNSFGTRGAERTQLQYYQSAHHKRMLAGNISRAPDLKFDYFTRIPLFRAITIDVPALIVLADGALQDRYKRAVKSIPNHEVVVLKHRALRMVRRPQGVQPRTHEVFDACRRHRRRRRRRRVSVGAHRARSAHGRGRHAIGSVSGPCASSAAGSVSSRIAWSAK